jgi:hypothetical protein
MTCGPIDRHGREWAKLTIRGGGFVARRISCGDVLKETAAMTLIRRLRIMSGAGIAGVRACAIACPGILVAVTALTVAAGSARAADPVDLLLVLAADVSRSVDHPKFLLQREGYAAAVSNPQVLDAIKSGANGKIALCFLEWSGYGAQKVVIDWTVIDGAATARKFGDQLFELPRSFADRTSISGGLDFAVSQLIRSPFEAPRQTIDVSGDGTNNAGRDVQLARDEALARGITINALVILSEREMPWNAEHTNPPGGLEQYFRDNVVGGPGAFVMVAEDFQSFGRAIVKKMIAEIAMPRMAPPGHAFGTTAGGMPPRGTLAAR